MPVDEPHVIDLDQPTRSSKDPRSGRQRFREAQMKTITACAIAAFGVLVGVTGSIAWMTPRNRDVVTHPTKTTVYGFVTQPLVFKSLTDSTAVFDSYLTITNLGENSIEINDVRAKTAGLALRGAQSAAWVSPNNAVEFAVEVTANCRTPNHETRLKADLDAYFAEGDVLSVPEHVSVDLASWKADITQSCYQDSP